MKTYYELLNVETDADKADIKKAFHRLAKQHHPDISPNHAPFIDILNAYETLIDDRKRNEYNWTIGIPQTAAVRVLPKNRTSYAVSLQDIAASRYYTRGKTRRSSSPFKQKGYDVRVAITKEELSSGVNAHIDIPAHVVCPLCRGNRTPCILCSDRGHILRAVSITVPIPSFLEDGSIFCVPVRRIKQKEYAFFMTRYLKVKIRIIRPGLYS
jgi:DnaJ-class molecular chaperone